MKPSPPPAARSPGVHPSAAGVLLLLTALACAPGPVADLAIANVTVVSMAAPDGVESGRWVTVSDGRIRTIGGAEDAPAAAVTVDGTGLTLIPGLQDMHTHPASESDLGLLVANGVTGARVMFGSSRALAWREAAASGELLAPSLVVGSPIFEGRPPPGFAEVIDTAGRVMVSTHADGVDGVREAARQGYDFIKVYNNIPADAYRGITETAAELGLPVAGHVPFDVGIEGALEAGQASIEHLRGYVWKLVPDGAPNPPGPDLRSRTLAWQHADRARMSGLAQNTLEAKVWNVPTLSVRVFTLPQAEVEAYLSRPAATFLSDGNRAFFRDRSTTPWLSNFTERDFAEAEKGNEAQEALVRALRDAGAGILAGTDISPWGFSLHRELELLVSAGLTPWEALASATRSSAEFLGVAQDLGTIAEGKVADLVLVSGDPLEDIRNTARIEGVVLAGRWIGPDALRSLRDAARPH